VIELLKSQIQEEGKVRIEHTTSLFESKRLRIELDRMKTENEHHLRLLTQQRQLNKKLELELKEVYETAKIGTREKELLISKGGKHKEQVMIQVRDSD